MRTAAHVPDCKMIMYQDCGHGVALAHGEDLVREIDSFLRERHVY